MPSPSELKQKIMRNLEEARLSLNAKEKCTESVDSKIPLKFVSNFLLVQFSFLSLNCCICGFVSYPIEKIVMHA